MKAKDGFVMRYVVDENIIMPTGDNIGKFDGAVVLNDVSAFVWEQLQQDVTHDELLESVLNEFDVAREMAETDLDALLDRLLEYGLIEK